MHRQLRRYRQREYSRTMPDRERRPDLDERFSLFPMEGEEVLERLLGTRDDPQDEDEPTEREDT